MKQIVFFGDSLTAGYGLLKPGTESFPALLQEKLQLAGLDYKVINAGISGDTSASGLQRIHEVFQYKMDIFVLELGANDLLKGLSAQATFANLQQIINLVSNRFPAVKLMLLGMQLPLWVPGERAAAFRHIYQRLAADNHMALVPFFLEGVAGVKHLNLTDGIHPLAEGYQIIAENVWPVLKELIENKY